MTILVVEIVNSMMMIIVDQDREVIQEVEVEVEVDEVVVGVAVVVEGEVNRILDQDLVLEVNHQGGVVDLLVNREVDQRVDQRVGLLVGVGVLHLDQIKYI